MIMKIKGISKKQHVYADYSYVPLVLVAPQLAGFNNKQASTICRAFSATALTYSLLTKAKWGVIKLIPYKTHAVLDIASGALAFAALALPDVGKNKPARNTFIAMGLTGLVVGTLSFIGAKRNKY